MSATFLLVCFLNLKESTRETRKNVSYFTSKPLFVLDNRILIFGVFKCHDVIKCPSIETQNTFYWQTWKVNTVWWSYLVSLCNITKEKYLLKNSTKNVAWKLVQGHFLIFKDSSVKRKLRGSTCWYGPILIVLLLHIKCK